MLEGGTGRKKGRRITMTLRRRIRFRAGENSSKMYMERKVALWEGLPRRQQGSKDKS